MQDRPGPEALLAIVAETLRNDIIPNLDGAPAYQARIVASLVAIVARQIGQGARDEAAETLRLREILGRVDGDLAELNAELARRLREGGLTLQSAGVAEHLWATTFSKLAVDQPGFARYRQLADKVSRQTVTNDALTN